MNSSNVQDMFSRPEDDNRVRESWERFLTNGGAAPDALRCLVGDSWERCAGANVDPSINRAPDPLAARDISILKHQHQDLLEAGKPVMILARDFLLKQEP